MRFKIAGKTYSLVFHHSLPITEAEMLKMDNRDYSYNERDMVGETKVILYEVKNAGTEQEERVEVERIVAFCAPEDNYVKAIGRKVALTKMLRRRAIEWMHDKGYRKLFWMIYFSKTAEMPEEIYVRYFGCPKISYAYNGVTLKGKD